MTIALDMLCDPRPSLENWSVIPPGVVRAMSGSMLEVMGSSTTPRMGRRSMALADIDPKYVSQSGIWEASEVETSRGSIRIQHLTAVPSANSACRPTSSSSGSSIGLGGSAAVGSGSLAASSNNPRFPKLEECAHFHYDCVELPPLKIHIRDDPSKPINLSSGGEDNGDKCAFSIEVVSGGQCWAIRRTHANLFMLDEQLHRCVWDRSFSLLAKVVKDNSQDHHDDCTEFLTKYLARLSELPTNKITCGTVLSWLELDNRGRHIVSSDDSAINTPAVAAACAVRKYSAQAADEISFEVGDMISVIDMPPPEDSIWWRGKRGFHVGFFPRDYVQVIGDKVPAGLPKVPSVRRLQRLSVSSSTSSSSSAPDKPVLRKHGKLIAFFRSFILSRPSRRRLKQSGILRERVFSCDLAEHLLNTGNEIPTVLKCCADFIERHGIVDGVYRLSGITSNIQKLRNAFDEDKIPVLEGDAAIKQDIHAVSSLLKMYFRELPNPLCTYQLYEKFVTAAKASDEERLFKMREVVHELPPPHYRTLEYLMKHLSRVATRSNHTGMTPKNMAIVWAPNLIRCRELEAGGVAALKGIGVQAVVTEYLIRHADLIFNDKLPANYPATTTVLSHKPSEPGRPKSLAISSPIRLMSLEEAQDKAKDDRKFIEVGGGPSSLPPKYHTVIDLPGRRGSGALKSKRSPMGWKHFFSRNRSFSKPQRKMFTPGDITVITKSMPVAGPQGMQTNWAGRLRPVKSVESLVSSPLYNITQETNSSSCGGGTSASNNMQISGTVVEEMEAISKSSPASPVTNDVHVLFHPPPDPIDPRNLLNPKTHNRSISHDSYFEFGEFREGNQVYIDETLEEETMSQSSKLSLENSSGVESNITSPAKGAYPLIYSNPIAISTRDTYRSKSEERDSYFKKSPITPPPSAASLTLPGFMEGAYPLSSGEELATSSSDDKLRSTSRSPLLRPKPRPSKWRDSEVQTSHTKLFDVGVSTQEDLEAELLPEGASNLKVTVGTSTGALLNEADVEIGNQNLTTVSEASATQGRYELDKNSSFDESSEMSTPDDHISTNIIYSPLINEISSASSSAEQLKAIVEESSESPNRSREHISLFVCPLYEAGITVSDLASSDSSNSSSNGKTIEETSTNIKTTAPQYENVTLSSSCRSEHNKSVPSVVLQVEKSSSSGSVNHVYVNDRIYQNEPIAPSRKRQTDKLPDTPKTVQNEQRPSEEMYYGAGEHYENMSESDYKVSSEGGHIYEDIGERQQSGNFNDPDRYEMVGESSLASGNGASSASIATIGSNTALNIPMHVPKEHNPSDDEEGGEAMYESVRFQKVDSQPHPVAHHYSEIEEKSPDRTELLTLVEKLAGHSDEESSPSHSRTDEIVTYLEVQTPSFNIKRKDSLEDQENSNRSDEPSSSSYGCGGPGVLSNDSNGNSGTVNSPLSPVADEGEIRHIDSPGVVENPLYSLEIRDDIDEHASKDNENDDNDISMNESISLSISLEEPPPGEDSASPPEKPFKSKKRDNEGKLLGLGRCNSAPLAETKYDFIVTEILRHDGTEAALKDFQKLDNDSSSKNSTDFHSENGITAFRNNIQLFGGGSSRKISLCKRFSEPSLLFSNNTSKNSTTGNNKTEDAAAAAAWKLADAKRLAHRKQSVKELLSKFESRDSPSPTGSGGSSSSPGPGLPLPFGGGSISNSKASVSSRNKGGSGRFQHHRFSVGDILMTQSMSSAEELSHSKSSMTLGGSMVRSDTYPELRSSSAKTSTSEGGSASKENVLVEIGLGSSNEDSPMVTEKVQQALRVAMSAVDMNDPTTRERIEKIKEERRSFFRQNISSKITTITTVTSTTGHKSPDSNFPTSTETPPPRESPLPKKSPGIIDVNEPLSGQFSSLESESLVFTCKTTSVSELMKPTAVESPRKRAFTEDIPPAYSNSMKTIKTEVLRPATLTLIHSIGGPESNNKSSAKYEETADEINVKEKIALWTLQKREISKSTICCANILESQKVQGLVPVDKRDTFQKPLLRREVTTSSIEIAKSKMSRAGVGRSDSGKKIKDMAAFFEAKQF